MFGCGFNHMLRLLFEELVKELFRLVALMVMGANLNSSGREVVAATDLGRSDDRIKVHLVCCAHPIRVGWSV